MFVGTEIATHPNVYFWSRVLLPFEHLGGSVGRGATPRRQQLSPLVEVGESKVGYLDIHAGVQQKVLRLQQYNGNKRWSCQSIACPFNGAPSPSTHLQIPVHDVSIVTVFDSRQDLPEFVASRSLIHATKAGDIICKGIITQTHVTSLVSPIALVLCLISPAHSGRGGID